MRRVNELTECAQKYYPDEWLAAENATSVADIKDSIEKDSARVRLSFPCLWWADYLIAFRSLSITVILVA
jgi:hypothetical protein